MPNLYALVDMCSWAPYAFSVPSWPRGCISLYSGESETELAEVAPYIGAIEKVEQFLEEMVVNSSICSNFVLLSSAEELDLVRTHLRKFLTIALESGALMYFRYYDPRILRDFLPTCDSEQLRQFFGPVEAFALQGDVDRNWLIFRLRNGELHTGVVSGLPEAVSSTTLW